MEKKLYLNDFASELPILDIISIFIILLISIFDINSMVPPFVLGIILIISGVLFFFSYEKYYSTLITIKSIFTLMWFLSAGLSLLRLHPLQKQWSSDTWIVVCLTYIGFMTGTFLQTIFSKNKLNESKLIQDSESSVDVIFLLGLIIIGAFVCDCLYSKEIPILSSEMASYQEFGFPIIHYFTVFGCLYPGIAYGAIKQCKNRQLYSIKKRISLIKIEATIIALFPILAVSRMQLLIELFVLLFFWYMYGWKEQKVRKFYLLLIIVLAIVIWIVLSSFRNQDYLYISTVFKLNLKSNIESALWQIYLYIGFGFDNLNYLINHFVNFSNGQLVFRGLLSIIGLDNYLDPMAGNTDNYRILLTFNTYTMAKDPFMDFGIAGVFPYMLFIGFFSSYIERKSRFRKSYIWMSAYALVVYGLIVCFFNNIFAAKMIVADLLIILLINSLTKHRYERNNVG